MFTDNNSLSNHPVSLVSRLSAIWPDADLEFARYIYVPQQRGSRHIFRIAATNVTTDWLSQELLNLKENEELALQSRVYTPSRKFHIGMIDFACDTTRDPRPQLKLAFGETAKDFEVYKSGRSYHAYHLTELSDSDWINFMSKMLISDTPENPTFDARWIGHRIIDGYSALRWSCQTNQYKQLPELCRFEAK